VSGLILLVVDNVFCVIVISFSLKGDLFVYDRCCL